MVVPGAGNARMDLEKRVTSLVAIMWGVVVGPRRKDIGGHVALIPLRNTCRDPGGWATCGCSRDDSEAEHV